MYMIIPMIKRTEVDFKAKKKKKNKINNQLIFFFYQEMS